ncbi:MAG: hypothetical protein R2715_25005 [Ilumatobacteraceae bacterium]
MSNLGFHRAMKSSGIEVVTTAVGDRYVLEALNDGGLSLGGEQSGLVHRAGVRHDRRRAAGRPTVGRPGAPQRQEPADLAREVMTTYPQVRSRT